MKVAPLCGGKGMRWNGSGEGGPKALAMIGDRPIVWHVMDVYSRSGFREFVLCRRLRSAGWRVRFEPAARMVHLMGTSVRRERARTTRLRLRGEALYFELCGTRWQRWASALLQIAGCSVRSAALGLVALLGGAQGRARAASAGAYLAAAVERSRSLGAEATND